MLRGQIVEREAWRRQSETSVCRHMLLAFCAKTLIDGVMTDFLDGRFCYGPAP